jgi:pimeloyl-ACP methyl ester carboxylesterase
MTTFVMVPGGWHGGWNFDPLASILRARGHTVTALTLTGLRPDDDQATVAATNLDTHVRDVVDALSADRLTGVTLVGHSYGGMVVAGVVDRVPQRIAKVVYVDACVPGDGDSCWSLLTPAYRQLFLDGARQTGYSVAPPPWPTLDPRTVPHPLASFVQGLRLANAPGEVPAVRHEFVYLTGWHGTPFTGTYERLREHPGWRTHTLGTGHDAMAEAPAELAALLTG